MDILKEINKVVQEEFTTSRGRPEKELNAAIQQNQSAFEVISKSLSQSLSYRDLEQMLNIFDDVIEVNLSSKFNSSEDFDEHRAEVNHLDMQLGKLEDTLRTLADIYEELHLD